MNATQSSVLLFKTNIQSMYQQLRLKFLLDQFTQIERWCIDMEDQDRVLKIISRQLSAEEIIRPVRNLGFECAELE
jgi:hypothetical protein